MRQPQKKTRWLAMVILLTVCFSLVAALALGQGNAPEKPKQAGEKGQLCSQGQAPGKGLCTAGGECQVPKSPCQTVGQPSNNNPTDAAGKAEKEKKNK